MLWELCRDSRCLSGLPNAEGETVPILIKVTSEVAEESTSGERFLIGMIIELSEADIVRVRAPKGSEDNEVPFPAGDVA